MSDEDPFEIVHLEHDDVEEILEWAVGAAAMVTLMHNSPDHAGIEEAMERLEGYIEAVQIMYDNMPDILVPHAADIATEAIESAERDEVEVQRFRQELEGL